MQQLRAQYQKTIPLLTTREKEVLQLLILGNTCKEVAKLLFVSFETVKTHRRSLYLKLDVKTGVQLGAVGLEYAKYL